MFQILLIISLYGVFVSVEAILMQRKRKQETKRMIDEFERRHPVKQDKDG